MKIAIVISNILKCGGTERVVCGIANYLSQKYKVEIISLFSNGGESFFELSRNITIHHLSVNSYENKSFRYKIVGWIKSINSYRKFVKKINPDIYIGTSRNTNIMALLFRNNNIVIGCEHFSALSPMNGFLRIFRDNAYKKLDSLVVLTQKDCNYYKENKIKAEVIPNSVSYTSCNNIQGKSKIALAVGRHSKEKAFDKLIRIWSQIENQNPDWNLYIIGDGELFDYNKSLANEIGLKKVSFIPFQKNIQEYYKQASLYLMTSLYEAFPMVLIEAQTHGCVCISYNCETGPAEIINDGINGCLVEYDNSKMFVEKFHMLANNAELMKDMAKNAIHDAERFSPNAIMPKWLNLINKFSR